MYSTYLGGVYAAPDSIAVEPMGNVLVSGRRTDGTSEYIAQLNATGTALVESRWFPRGSRASRIALDAAGRIHASGGESGMVTVVDPAPAVSGVLGIANAGGSTVSGRVAPGELISIYGWSLGGRVLFNDTPGAILYASPSQINTIVPFESRPGERLTISVRNGATETARAIVATAAAQPEIFKLPTGQDAALNEDGTVNTAANPAKVGSIVSLWGTGSAGWRSDVIEGSTNTTELQYLPVSAAVSSMSPSRVQFAGAAPGMPARVFQINLKLPDTLYFPPDQQVQRVGLPPCGSGGRRSGVGVREAVSVIRRASRIL